MSSISSLSGSAQGLYAFVRSLAGANQSSGTNAASSTNQLSSGQLIRASAGHHHHHAGGGAMKQIQEAVSTALQNAQSSGPSTDPNQIIEDAITKVLRNDNTAKGGATQGTAADPDGDDDGPAGAGGIKGVNAQSFQQLLQSFGVRPQQFHQDLLAAVKDAQGGQMNPLTALQSFPVGSTVDMVG